MPVQLFLISASLSLSLTCSTAFRHDFSFPFTPLRLCLMVNELQVFFISNRWQWIVKKWASDSKVGGYWPALSLSKEVIGGYFGRGCEIRGQSSSLLELQDTYQPATASEELGDMRGLPQTYKTPYRSFPLASTGLIYPPQVLYASTLPLHRLSQDRTGAALVCPFDGLPMAA